MEHETGRRGDAVTQIPGDDRRDEIESVESAPDDKRPVGAMPQPAQQKRHDEVEIPSRPQDTIAAKRDVEVVAKPRRKRDMPPRPESIPRSLADPIAMCV